MMAAVDLGTPIGLRDRAMLEVLYATGIWRHEVAALELSDIERERGVMLTREGKGGKDRLLPLGERALYWLGEYLERGRPLLDWSAQDGTLFLREQGKRLRALWLSTLVARRVDAAALGKRGGCHLWRHTMATLMLEGGADLRFIHAMLGHAELSTTQIYTQVAIRQLQAVQAMTHPGAKRRVRDGDPTLAAPILDPARKAPLRPFWPRWTPRPSRGPAMAGPVARMVMLQRTPGGAAERSDVCSVPSRPVRGEARAVSAPLVLGRSCLVRTSSKPGACAQGVDAAQPGHRARAALAVAAG